MIELPDAVQRYFGDQEIATAVNALASGKQKALPPGLKWGELETYYEALAAANQVKTGLAAALHRLWEQVWTDAAAELEMLSPAQVTEHYRSNTPDDCWEDDGYGRCLKLNDQQWLYAEVQVDREATYLSLSIDRVPRAAIRRELPGWTYCDADEWILFQGPAPAAAQALATLRSAARDAVAAARRLANG